MFLVLFFVFAAASSIVPYVSGAPYGILGYPIFWNALSVFFFILFLLFSWRFALGNYLYKAKDGKNYFKFIQECTRKTQTLSSCLFSVERSIENIVRDAQRNPPKEDAKLFEKPDVPKKNKPAWNTIVLLSAQNVVEYIVENDNSAVESILKAYEKKGTTLTNTILLYQLVNRLLFNENSMMRKMGRIFETSIFSSLFSEELIRKYDLLFRLSFKISDLSADSLRTFENFYCYVLSKTDEMYFSFAVILDTINQELCQTVSRKHFLSYNDMCCETMKKCCQHNWNIKDLNNRNFFIRRFSDYLDRLNSKKQTDLELYYDLQKFWDVMQENKESEFATEYFNYLIDLVNNDILRNVHLVRIYLIMKKMGFDITMLKMHLFPIIKDKLKSSCSEDSIIESVIPFNMTKQDVLSM